MSSNGKSNGHGGNGKPPLGDAPAASIPGREARALPKRFYKDVSVGVAGPARFVVLLDGRMARTPKKSELALPTLRLAEAVAAEWADQLTSIDPALMLLTRLANTAIDGVTGREADVAADIVKYAGSDLLCYRAERPHGLVDRQADRWDPVLDWAADRLGAEFVTAVGLMHVEQPQAALAACRAAVEDLDAFRLTALHVMTTLTGSALLALAVLEGERDAAAAWAAAHVDEDWQIAEWGEDAEAMVRRQKRWQEMEAAARLLALLA